MRSCVRISKLLIQFDCKRTSCGRLRVLCSCSLPAVLTGKLKHPASGVTSTSACCRLAFRPEHRCWAAANFRHQRSSWSPAQQARQPLLRCCASRQERQSHAATPSEAPSPSKAPGDYRVATASASGDFGDSSAVAAQSLDEVDHLGEDAVKVEKLAEGWGALPARYQMVVATSVAFVICNMDKASAASSLACNCRIVLCWRGTTHSSHYTPSCENPSRRCNTSTAVLF